MKIAKDQFIKLSSGGAFLQVQRPKSICFTSPAWNLPIYWNMVAITSKQSSWLLSEPRWMDLIWRAQRLQWGTAVKAKQTLSFHRDLDTSACRIVQRYSTWIWNVQIFERLLYFLIINAKNIFNDVFLLVHLKNRIEWLACCVCCSCCCTKQFKCYKPLIFVRHAGRTWPSVLYFSPQNNTVHYHVHVA